MWPWLVSSCKVDRVVLRDAVTQLSLTEKVSCYGLFSPIILNCSITVPNADSPSFRWVACLLVAVTDDTNLMTHKTRGTRRRSTLDRCRNIYELFFFMAMCTLSLSLLVEKSSLCVAKIRNRSFIGLRLSESVAGPHHKLLIKEAWQPRLDSRSFSAGWFPLPDDCWDAFGLPPICFPQSAIDIPRAALVSEQTVVRLAMW